MKTTMTPKDLIASFGKIGVMLTDDQVEQLESLMKGGVAVFPENAAELFSLRKIKLTNKGGVEIDFAIENRADGQLLTDTYSFTSDSAPHPDLIDAVKELKPHLAQCYGVVSYKDFELIKSLTDKEKKSLKDLKKVITAMANKGMEVINMTGCSIHGDDDSRAVIINGTRTQANNSKTAINSPRIALKNNTFGFEESVKKIIEKINDEARDYMFNNKRAQLEIPLEEEKAA